MPAVLGAVLAPRAIREDVLALDALEPIDLGQETKLFLQALGRVVFQCHARGVCRLERWLSRPK
jgi:hypothetical protein